MNNNEIMRKMLDAIHGSAEPAKKKSLTEDVNITITGPEADEFVSRLAALAGTSAPSGMIAPPTPATAVLPAPPSPMPASMPMPSGMSDNVPVAAEYSCDSCGSEDGTCDCQMGAVDEDHSGAMCESCGMPESMCECGGMATTASGMITGATAMEENADHDHGHTEFDDDGEEVDPDTYMYKAPTVPQRIVKGTQGDNPMVKEEAMEAYKKIVESYVAYIGESENDDGAASPLTASNRDEFDKDPDAGKEPDTTGEMSPMSKIVRQKVKR